MAATHRRGQQALVTRLQNFWMEHPGATLTTREAVARFGGTPHAFREAVYRLRRAGTRVRCDRVWRMKSDAQMAADVHMLRDALAPLVDIVAGQPAAGLSSDAWARLEDARQALAQTAIVAAAGKQRDDL